MINNDIEELYNLETKSLNKTQLLVKTKQMQKILREFSSRDSTPSENAVNNIILRLEAIEAESAQNKKDLIQLKTENSSLKKRIKELEDYADDTEESFICIEKAVSKVEQYTRRENIEVCGIPDNIQQKELEGKIIEIVNSIKDTEINTGDIVACHRLQKEKTDKAANVIVRFINRNDTIDVLRNKKKLKEKENELGYENLLIHENLCT